MILGYDLTAGPDKDLNGAKWSREIPFTKATYLVISERLYRAPAGHMRHDAAVRLMSRMVAVLLDWSQCGSEVRLSGSES